MLSLYCNQKHRIMKYLVAFTHTELKNVMFLTFRKEEAITKWWQNLPNSFEFDIICTKELKKSGHRYELECAKFDEKGNIYSKYVCVNSKKEAIFVKNEIKKKYPNIFMFNIKNLY